MAGLLGVQVAQLRRREDAKGFEFSTGLAADAPGVADWEILRHALADGIIRQVAHAG